MNKIAEPSANRLDGRSGSCTPLDSQRKQAKTSDNRKRARKRKRQKDMQNSPNCSIICNTGTPKIFDVLLNKTLLNPVLEKDLEIGHLHFLRSWHVDDLLGSPSLDSVLNNDLWHIHQLFFSLRHEIIENLLPDALQE